MSNPILIGGTATPNYVELIPPTIIASENFNYDDQNQNYNVRESPFKKISRVSGQMKAIIIINGVLWLIILILILKEL